MGEMEETNLKEKTSYTDILGKCTIKLQKALSSDPIHHALMEFFGQEEVSPTWTKACTKFKLV